MTWDGLSPPYATIVADPPWPNRGTARAFGAAGRAWVNPAKGTKSVATVDIRPQARYGTLTVAEMCSMPVRDLVASNAHLYLWTTCSDLPDALTVLAAWGFTYKTMLTWVKRGRIGLGAYFRTQTEHVLFGIRGSLPTLATNQLNFFDAPKRGHSVKPPAFLDIVERSSPGPYVELFARAPRLGWDHWGYGYERPAAYASRA